MAHAKTVPVTLALLQTRDVKDADLVKEHLKSVEYIKEVNAEGTQPTLPPLR
jgi:hypothetical protein